MKLLTHTSLFMVTMSMILFFFCGISFYYVFKKFSADRLETELKHEMSQVLQDPTLFIAAVDAEVPFFDHIEVRFIESMAQSEMLFFDSLLFVNDQQMPTPVLFIQFNAKVLDEYVEFRIYKSTISSDDLTERIAGLIIVLTILFSFGIYILNRHVFSRTWKGFYQALSKVQFFKAGDEIPEFKENEIDEFEDLNSELSKMTKRISSDYHNLKSFTSHATHEFQTPLAVIISKADLLMQNENYSGEQYQHIQSIQQYARQLSRMTQALALLFRIDNQQFIEISLISPKEIIEKNLPFFKEQCEHAEIELKIELSDEIKFEMPADLAEILILNLMRNAMIHNRPKGVMSIMLKGTQLVISNTGQDSALDSNSIFREFYKGGHSSGLGLGLSIVHKIAEIYPVCLDYTFDNQMHTFTLSFH